MAYFDRLYLDDYDGRLNEPQIVDPLSVALVAASSGSYLLLYLEGSPLTMFPSTVLSNRSVDSTDGGVLQSLEGIGSKRLSDYYVKAIRYNLLKLPMGHGKLHVDSETRPVARN